VLTQFVHDNDANLSYSNNIPITPYHHTLSVHVSINALINATIMILFKHPTNSLSLLNTNIKPFIFEANTQRDVVMQFALCLWAALMLATHMAWFVVW
jgi:hypothetical protein